MSAGRILITGADGYLGSRLARRLLETTDASLVLWGHRPRESPSNRVEIRAGDLADADPFSGIDPRSLRSIVHTAAVIRFNVERDLAERVNLGGTRKVLELASRCPNLESFVLTSSLYACGLRSGAIEERRFDDRADFSNHYEWSKWASEELLQTEFASLPWKIARVATVIADDASGTVSQQNSFHNTLKLLYFGLLSILPGKPEVRPYFVTGDFASEALAAILERGERGSIFHVARTRNETATLGRLVDIAFEAFLEDPGFRARRLLKPLFCDAEAFDLLVQGIDDAGGEIVRQALASVAPFAKQLFLEKDVRNERLASLVGEYRTLDPEALLRNTCRRLVATRFGRETNRAAS